MEATNTLLSVATRSQHGRDGDPRKRVAEPSTPLRPSRRYLRPRRPGNRTWWTAASRATSPVTWPAKGANVIIAVNLRAFASTGHNIRHRRHRPVHIHHDARQYQVEKLARAGCDHRTRHERHLDVRFSQKKAMEEGAAWPAPAMPRIKALTEEIRTVQGVQGFKGSKYKVQRVQGFKGSRVQGSRVQGFKGSRFKGKTAKAGRLSTICTSQ